MRYREEHKALVRAHILDEAAKAFRQHGPKGVGIVDVMASAGLTHGAFYAHFKSKSDLLAETIRHMFFETASRLGTEPIPDCHAPSDLLGRYLDWYLSAGHRDSRERGCPIAFLGSDVARLPDSAREAFQAATAKLSHSLDKRIAALPDITDKPSGTELLAELVGSLVIARALPDAADSERLLVDARARLRARLGLSAAGKDASA
jgi:TetR/AcrR family transcriptional repressor of nem operon